MRNIELTVFPLQSVQHAQTSQPFNVGFPMRFEVRGSYTEPQNSNWVDSWSEYSCASCQDPFLLTWNVRVLSRKASLKHKPIDNWIGVPVELYSPISLADNAKFLTFSYPIDVAIPMITVEDEAWTQSHLFLEREIWLTKFSVLSLHP